MERARLQFRAEAFNLPNHPNFRSDSLNTAWGSATFRRVFGVATIKTASSCVEIDLLTGGEGKTATDGRVIIVNYLRDAIPPARGVKPNVIWSRAASRRRPGSSEGSLGRPPQAKGVTYEIAARSPRQRILHPGRRGFDEISQ